MRARFFPSVSAEPIPPCVSRRATKLHTSMRMPTGRIQTKRRARQNVFSMRPDETLNQKEHGERDRDVRERKPHVLLVDLGSLHGRHYTRRARSWPQPSQYVTSSAGSRVVGPNLPRG